MWNVGTAWELVIHFGSRDKWSSKRHEVVAWFDGLAGACLLVPVAGMKGGRVTFDIDLE